MSYMALQIEEISSKYNKIRFILDLIIHSQATHTKAAVFWSKNKGDAI